MVRALAGDVGGTKTLLQLVDCTALGPQVVLEQSYPSTDFNHLNPIVKQFLATAQSESPLVACFAVAGPVHNDRAVVTNRSWTLDARQMEGDLGIPKIRLINDFAAVGYGILALQPEDFVVLQDQPITHQAPIAVLGAGTGLGEALLVWGNGDYEVIPTEGGHGDFAARTDLEWGLLTYLRAKHGRVSVERIVSGQGIATIYEYLKTVHPTAVNPDIEQQMQQEDPAAVIAQHALNRSDALCTQVLDLFVSAYGAEAGNLALKSLPYGGIYLAGGVGAKILPRLQAGDFMDAFLDKGRMRPLLETFRVSLIVHKNVGQLGAALLACRL